MRRPLNWARASRCFAIDCYFRTTRPLDAPSMVNYLTMYFATLPLAWTEMARLTTYSTSLFAFVTKHTEQETDVNCSMPILQRRSYERKSTMPQGPSSPLLRNLAWMSGGQRCGEPRFPAS